MVLTLEISSCAGRFYDFPGEQFLLNSQSQEQTHSLFTQKQDFSSPIAEENSSLEAYAAAGCLTALLGASVYAGYSFHETLDGFGAPLAGFATLGAGVGMAELADQLAETKEEKLQGIAYSLCFGALAGTAAATIYELKKIEENSLIPVKLHQE